MVDDGFASGMSPSKRGHVPGSILLYLVGNEDNITYLEVEKTVHIHSVQL